MVVVSSYYIPENYHPFQVAMVAVEAVVAHQEPITITLIVLQLIIVIVMIIMVIAQRLLLLGLRCQEALSLVLSQVSTQESSRCHQSSRSCVPVSTI